MASNTEASSEPAPDPRIDPHGRFAVWAAWSYATIGFYVVLVLLLIYVDLRTPDAFLTPHFPLLLAGVLVLYLARYLSTHYVLDAEKLYARRLFGSRSLVLESIYRIRITSLRELAPVGMFGTWGWRGRMWSPIGSLGKFDTVSTVAPGVLVTGGSYPVFLSPRDPLGFARELSRRVRSAGVELDEDDGHRN